MHNILLLTKVFLKTGGNSFASDSNKKKKSAKIGNGLMYLLICICFLPLIGLIFTVLNNVYGSFKALNQEGYLMTFVLSSVSMVIFIFSMFSIASILFFSKDIEYLLPMPFKAREITIAKFLYILFGEYLISAFILIPAYAVWIINSNPGVMFYVAAVIVFLVTPIVPILLSAIIIMPIMRFSGLVKHKDAFTIVGSFIGIGFGVGINIFTQSVGKNANSPGALQNILQSKNELINSIATIFVNVKSSTKAIVLSGSSEGIINLLILFVIIVAALGIYMVLSDALYLKGAMSSSGSVSKKKKISSEQFEKSTDTNSPLLALVKREIKIILRTPVYLMNCGSTVLLVPICCIPVFLSGNLFSQLGGLASTIASSESAQIITLMIIYAISAFTVAVAPASGTAISREGSSIYVSKYIPVDYKKQLDAKLIVSFSISAISLILILAIVEILLKLNAILFIASLLITLLISSFASIVALLIDVMKPKLSWNTEEQAVKQNFNPFFAFAISAVILALGILPTILLIDKGLWINILVILAILAAINVAAYYVLSNYGVKRFASIE